MAQITAVANQKGGVGKTTGTVNIGTEISERRKKVLLIDIDPSGNLTTATIGKELPEAIETVAASMTGGSDKVVAGTSHSLHLFDKDEMADPLKVSDNLYLIGSSKLLTPVGSWSTDSIYEFVDSLEVLAEEFDYVFIDCPPSAGLFQTSALAAANTVLIPTHLGEDSISAVQQVIDTASTVKKRLNPKLEVMGIYVTGRRNQKIHIQEQHEEELKEKYPTKVFSSCISFTAKFEEARYFNQTIKQYLKKSKYAKEYTCLAEEIMSVVEEGAVA